MKKIYLLLCLMCATFINVKAQTTYKDVAAIFYAHCTVCHNPGGLAPISLIDYTQTSANSKLVKSYITSGLMPPWPPDTAYHHFVGERVLTAYEENKIINWIDSGAAKGDTTQAPMEPVYTSKYQLHGTPDLIVKIPTFTSNATTADAYNCFVLPTNLTQDRYIRAYEVVPGNVAIVHHVLVSMDTSGTATSDLSGGCFTMPGSDIGIGGYAPGSAPVVYPGKAPLKVGFLLKAHSNIVLQIHYPVGTAGKVDSTEVRFFFYPVGTTGIREIYTSTILQNWSMVIPPNTVKTYTAKYPSSGGIPIAVSLYASFPHQHEVGVSLVNYAYSGTDTIPLIRINKWNFDWQGYYTYPYLVKVPAGYTFFASHTYDNTTNNPYNPFSPPQTIYAGTSTTNEMLFDSYQYLVYQPGDDTININNLLQGDTLLGVQQPQVPAVVTRAYPNPFNKQVYIGYTLNAPANVSVVVYNMYGSKVRTLANNKRAGLGYYESVWDGKSDNGNLLPPGIYLYTVTANDVKTTGRLVLIR